MSIHILDRKATQKAGVDGVLLTVDGTGPGGAANVSLDYSAFADAAGAGYGERLHLVQLPVCVLSTPTKPECRRATPLVGRNDADQHTVTASSVPVPGTATSAKSLAASNATTVLAATASTAGPVGDYKASPLSSASTWSTALNSGSFTWSYDMPVPSVPTSLAPSVKLSYSSGAIDGRTSNSNNQGSWAGDGFDIAPGFIERSYKPCADDGVKTDGVDPGDLCWAYDNATISFDGHAGELIPVGADEWRIKGDDNTKVVRLRDTSRGNGDNDGEYFQATTPNGTRYYFGYNRLPNWGAGKAETKSVETVPVFGNNTGEPCNKATFADSWCQQGRRWNLDLVIDANGNDLTYWYKPESNTYGRNLKEADGTPYVRAAILDHIEYGQQQKDIYSTTVKPMARVNFTTAERCLETTTALCDPASIDTNRQYWYDTPWDQNCNAGSKCDAGRFSPSFWTRTRLAKVTTQTLQADGTYKPIDEWALHHKWGTADADYQLLLDSIQHTGLGAAPAVVLPATTLSYTPRIGRLDKPDDGRLAYYKQRLSTITDESGGQLDVNYSQPACSWDHLPTPQSNTTHCFPQQYQPSNPEPVTTEWFNKYVVDSVVATDRTGGAPDMYTKYSYVDGGAWAYDDSEGITKDKLKTWSQWRGHAHVQVQTGGDASMSTQVDHYFLRGMNGDRTDPSDKSKLRSITVPDGEGTTLTDDEAWEGFEYRTETFDKPGGKILAKAVSTPWKKETAKRVRDWGTTTANLTGTGTSRSFTSLDAGAGEKWRETRSNNWFDDRGRTIKSEDLGDTGVVGDNKCTRTTYADNTAAWILTGAIHTETVAADCTSTPDRDTQPDGTSTVLSDTRVRYDEQTYGSAPIKGLVTMSETLKSRSGKAASYLDDTTTFDAYGRQLTANSQVSSSVFDPTDDTKAPVTTAVANPRTTTTLYTPTTGRPTKVVTTTPPATVGNAASAQTTTAYYDLLRGLPTVTIDQAARRNDVLYDALGRPLKAWKPNRSRVDGVTPNTEFRYSNDANAIQSVTTLSLNNDGTQDATNTLYDGFGRVRQTQAAGQDGGRILTDTFFDERGQAKLAYAPYYATGAPSKTLFKVEDATGVETQTASEYDGLGRTTKSTLLKGNGQGAALATTTTTYGGDRVTVIPPRGATPTTSISDAQGRVTELRQYQATNESGPAGPYDTTSYGYDAAGHLTQLTGPAGATWAWTYDRLGRQTRAVDPDSGTTTKTYNDRGEVLTTTDGRGKSIAHVYDNLSRELETHDSTATGPLLTSQTWDPAGNQGQLASSTRYAAIGGKTYPYKTTLDSYDALYRPTKTTLSVPSVPGQEGLAGSYIASTAYNLDGTTQSTSYPAAGSLPAEVLTYTYDNLHRPVTTGSNLSSYLTGQSYSLTGKPLQATLNAGAKNTWITNDYEYGTQRLHSSRTDQQDINGAARAVEDGYDEAGNVTSLSDVSRTGIDRQCFQYDYLARLTQAFTPIDAACPSTPDGSKLGGAAPYWSSYTYNTDGTRKSETQHDPTGDISKDRTRTYTYAATGAAHPHSLLDVSTLTGSTGSPVDETYAYDAVGNTAERHLRTSPAVTDDQSLNWDLEGHLSNLTDTATTKSDSSAVTTKKTSDYVYDTSGNRLSAHVLDTADPAAENTTLYLGATELNLVKGAAKPTATRYYALGGATAVRTDDNQVTFQVTDHHGTADTSISAADGALTQRRTTPFGQERGTSPANWAGTKGFVGGTKDTDTGLTHLGAREYDPNTGRFISVDPLLVSTDPQSLNGYAYSDNNPLTISDPTGLCGDVDCPTRPCPDCENTTPGHVPGAPKLTEAGKQKKKQGKKNKGKTKSPSGPNPSCARFGRCDGWGHQPALGDTIALGLLRTLVGIAEQIYTPLNHDCWGDNEVAGGCDLTTQYDAWANANGYDTESDAYQVPGFLAAMFLSGHDGETPESPKGGRPKGGLCSFTADTPVLLENGKTKPIGEIEVGDRVEAADPETGEHQGPRPVDATLVNRDKDLVDLKIQAPDQAVVTLHTTSKHPFWDATTHSWVPAGELPVGHALAADKGQLSTLLAVTTVSGSADMHNLTVDDLHTYYVLAGDTPVLVHNAGGDPVTPNIILRGLQQIQDGTLEQRRNPDGTLDFYKGGDNRKTAWWEGAKIYAPDPNNHDYRILEKNGQYKWVGPNGNQKGAGHNYNKLMDIVPRCP
ncbi:polymorphic toxin-type HINT domain-containing protein [Streptomyces violascens]|uniref:polymorphic toxin-type HINT domain-containing protein n=1 Tax=Streptomyces violascens TaxID=67381 RepID=UPI0037963207